jgi:hypothetical protein
MNPLQNYFDTGGTGLLTFDAATCAGVFAVPSAFLPVRNCVMITANPTIEPMIVVIDVGNDI